MRILLVEDDSMIGEAVLKGLQQEGLTVDWTLSGEDALLAFAVEPYELVVLDLGLPGISGLDVLNSIRAEGAAVPVIILTAWDKVSQRVLGLDSGADDYLIKPFALDELAARIRVLLRRHSGIAQSEIHIGDLTINLTTRNVSFRGKSVYFSSREYAILLLFVREPGRVFSRGQIEERIYGWNEEVASNSVEVHIHNIRRKTSKNLILNIRGLGYVLESGS